MGMSKHTPGPWKAVPTAFGPIDIVVSDGRDIVTVYGGGTGNKEANARLIAAAPDMLEALKQAQTNFKTYDRFKVDVDAMRKIEAAIAKATGSAK